MAEVFVTTLPLGKLGVIRVSGSDPDVRKLTKTMFELSRDGSDMTTHFDPAVHTLSAIAAGLPGHVSLSQRVVQDTDLPPRTFRDAWEDAGGSVVVNMPKARVIHIDRIRVAGDQELVRVGRDLEKAIDDGDTTEEQRLRNLRQTLRALPDSFDLSRFTTPEELDVAWPEELPERL